MFRCQRKDCDIFRYTNDPKHPSFTCTSCKDIYCSEDCMSKDVFSHVTNCFKESKDEAEKSLMLLGYSDFDNLHLAKIAGKSIIGLPHIHGEIPKCMIPIRDERYYNELRPEDKLTVDSVIASSDFEYITFTRNIGKLWLHKLTDEQKQEINSFTYQSQI